MQEIEKEAEKWKSEDGEYYNANGKQAFIAGAKFAQQQQGGWIEREQELISDLEKQKALVMLNLKTIERRKRDYQKLKDVFEEAISEFELWEQLYYRKKAGIEPQEQKD